MSRRERITGETGAKKSDVDSIASESNSIKHTFQGVLPIGLRLRLLPRTRAYGFSGRFSKGIHKNETIDCSFIVCAKLVESDNFAVSANLRR
jgi:hypothetical protein